ncbi:hypothetical protein I350_02817 [Cryptococcus amylolentus CBS 6273]|uniref:DUF300-domain-containing protein n=1 Tax=Cryptococcus amylolentus CBS 6273 TaxID=1296118 RepID=A0A1E3K9M3_9TREE|nr:hypothetical protein I350_02817 [Cryptococcus amylolentus CBS 6273]
MSLPNFPSSPHRPPAESSPVLIDLPSAGAGNHLPIWLLALCGAFTAVATGFSVMSIVLQLKNYRKPALQRAVVRIMVMVPLYAISSLIALFSLEAAFFIDAAFVIYTFLQLLITYLGGERSLLITLHGRPPIPHPFPVGLFLKPMDVSDPWVLLNLKRGVLQYVQVKPLLVVVTVISKATGTYQEGKFSATSGYTYVSVVYNISICLSLYCLAMFWVAVNKDLKPFRPVPKFLCVKGILFFSFWQGIGISLLVAMHAIKSVGPYTDAEHMSLALVDSLICFEMPIFAIAHQYAFQASDYIDNNLIHAARLPVLYAFRDAFGFKDVWQDTKDTFKGRGVSYQAYEPAEGGLHYGLGRQRRIRAGLRYSKGGKAKYWMPTPESEARSKSVIRPFTSLKRRVDETLAQREGYAPLLPQQANQVVHDDPYAPSHGWTGGLFSSSDSEDSDAPSLDFHSAEEEEDGLYERARRIGYAGFPNVEVSREEATRRRREEEEEILAGRRIRGEREAFRRTRTESGTKSGKGKGKERVYGAWADRDPIERVGSASSNRSQSSHLKPKPLPTKRSKSPLPSPLSPSSPFSIGEDEDDNGDDEGSQGDVDEPAKRPGKKRKKVLPPDAVDLVKDDQEAVEAARERERRRGEPQTKAPKHVYRRTIGEADDERGWVEEVQRVYAHAPGEHGADPEPEEVVDEVETSVIVDPPKHTMTLDGIDDDNPWA